MHLLGIRLDNDLFQQYIYPVNGIGLWQFWSRRQSEPVVN